MSKPFLLIIALVLSCNLQCQEPAAYPTLQEQRTTLSKRQAIHAKRYLDSSMIINDLIFLTSDTCEGRKPGTPGHAKAQERIIDKFRHAKIDSFNSSLVHSFVSKRSNEKGTNIYGWIKGTNQPNKYIVISAHYDHLGERNGITYYGADDNASGVACLLAMADYFKTNPLPYSIILVAFDKEETGLEGAYAFVDHLTTIVKKEDVNLNLNMDMIARSDKNEIYACGVRYYPALEKVVLAVLNQTSVNLLMGHDSGSPQEDWTTQSDHYAFHQKGIPFIYIGVEDHPDYHKPSDIFSKIDLHKYIENCNMITTLITSIK